MAKRSSPIPQSPRPLGTTSARRPISDIHKEIDSLTVQAILRVALKNWQTKETTTVNNICREAIDEGNVPHEEVIFDLGRIAATADYLRTLDENIDFRTEPKEKRKSRIGMLKTARQRIEKSLPDEFRIDSYPHDVTTTREEHVIVTKWPEEHDDDDTELQTREVEETKEITGRDVLQWIDDRIRELEEGKYRIAGAPSVWHGLRFYADWEEWDKPPTRGDAWHRLYKLFCGLLERLRFPVTLEEFVRVCIEMVFQDAGEKPKPSGRISHLENDNELHRRVNALRSISQQKPENPPK